jgi:hypothetical protein
MHLPELIWGLPPAELLEPEVLEHDVQTYLNQEAVIPRLNITSHLSAGGELIIDGRAYGRLVELESEEVEFRRDGRTVRDSAYLGKIRGRTTMDGVDPGALKRGESQLDGRQLAVQILKDYFHQGERVLRKGQIFNAPYHVAHLRFRNPSLSSRFVKLIQASGAFGDFEGLKGFWRKCARLIFSRNTLSLPIIIFRTVNRLVDEMVTAMEHEILNANIHARIRLEMDDEAQAARNEERRLERERRIREEFLERRNRRMYEEVIVTLAMNPRTEAAIRMASVRTASIPWHGS